MRLLTRRVRERDREYELMSVDAIIGSIAHEMRQPLAAIATNAGAALRFIDKASPNYNEVRDALKRISAESHRASDMFDGIRALFKNVDAGRGRIDINSIATEVVKSLRTELTAHGISMNSELAPGLPLVEGNRYQLHQVIFNLVQNAVEAMSATRERSRVLQVSTERCGPDAIALGIQDSGPGIKAEQVDRIFDAFVTTKPSGLGLGLAICRTIVLRHDGQLTVSSDGETGALFKLVLPVSTVEESPVPLDETLGSVS
jgi:signal transduction histidine kinase